jgi:hypothetical protein
VTSVSIGYTTTIPQPERLRFRIPAPPASSSAITARRAVHKRARSPSSSHAPAQPRTLADAAARPLTWCVFHRRLVPPLASTYRACSGAAKRYRWAAKEQPSHPKAARLRGSWCWRPHTWCRHQPQAAAPGRAASRSVVASPNGSCRTRRRHAAWSPAQMARAEPEGVTQRGRQPEAAAPGRAASRMVNINPKGSAGQVGVTYGEHQPEGQRRAGRRHGAWSSARRAAPGRSASRIVVVSPNGSCRTRRRHAAWSSARMARAEPEGARSQKETVGTCSACVGSQPVRPTAPCR